MKLFLWLVWLIYISLRSSKACRDVAELISGVNQVGGMIDGNPKLRRQFGIIPLIGRLMRNMLANGPDGYNGQYPNANGQYGPNPLGTYPGGPQGNNPLFNQQTPPTSPYYPNQLAGSNVPNQPVAAPTQPYYPGQPGQPGPFGQPGQFGQPNGLPQTQPVVPGTPYPNPALNVQQQPMMNPSG